MENKEIETFKEKMVNAICSEMRESLRIAIVREVGWSQLLPVSADEMNCLVAVALLSSQRLWCLMEEGSSIQDKVKQRLEQTVQELKAKI